MDKKLSEIETHHSELSDNARFYVVQGEIPAEGYTEFQDLNILDVKVSIDIDATPSYLGAAFNDGVLRVGSGLSYADGGDYITIAVDATYTTISGNDGNTNVTGAELEELTDNSYTILHKHIETRFIAYSKLLAADADGILVQRDWTDETVTTFAAIMDVPRNVTAYTEPGGGGTITGTITINGTNADGAVIDEVFTINEAGNTTHTGVKAFATVTSVVVDRTDETSFSRYQIGWGDKLGLLNGPLNAEGDVFKVNKNGSHLGSAAYTINTTYSTCLPAVAITLNDTFLIWYRPYKS